MGIEEVIIQIFQEHTPLLAFAAGLLLGDFLIFLAILSGAGKIPFGVVLVFGLLGDIFHDIIFYYISNSKLAYFFKKRFKLSKKRNIIINFIEKIKTGDNYLVPLSISKFFYGIRDIVVMYISHGEKNIKKYLLTITLAGFIWTFTITGIGWLAGRGFSQLINILKGIEKIVIVFLIVFLITFVGGKIVISLFIKLIKKKFN